VSQGGTVEAWTLNWDEDTGTLHKMRSKETEADYRYFREPDLLPIELTDDWKTQILTGLPELPLDRRMRFTEQYGLPEYDAEILTEERSLSEYFEAAVAAGQVDAKAISNWLMNDVLRLIREQHGVAANLALKPEHLAQIVGMVERGDITTNTGKELLDRVNESGQSPQEIVGAEGLAQVSDEAALGRIAAEIVDSNPDQVATYRGGKTTVIGWFVGQVMRETQGKANPQAVKKVLEDLLSE